MLVDGGYAHVVGHLWTRPRHWLAAPDNFTAGGSIRAGQDLNQGRLASTVGAKQSVNLAPRNVEIDAAQCDCPVWVFFRNPLEPHEKRFLMSHLDNPFLFFVIGLYKAAYHLSGQSLSVSLVINGRS
ncbi:hypothetical protein D3C85_1595480 [compost metagenome]